jgi:hypothetical protein
MAAKVGQPGSMSDSDIIGRVRLSDRVSDSPEETGTSEGLPPFTLASLCYWATTVGLHSLAKRNWNFSDFRERSSFQHCT